MAFALPYSDPETGIHTDAAYVRVESVIIDLVEKKIILMVVYYWDQAAAQANLKALRKLEHLVPRDRVTSIYRPSILGQVYTYLRQFVSEFEGAVDV
jgi:hypothetical protein